MINLQDSKILITGAGGFIGSHLTEALVRIGAKVSAFVHYNSRNDWGLLEVLENDVKKQIHVVPGDIRDPFMVKSAMKGVEVVFHLASLIAIPFSYRAPESYIETNVRGTLNVMQASLECGVGKVVHTSTSEVYGTARYAPIDEDHPLQGQSPYSASKIAADKIAESFHLSFGLPVATIRPFNVFGPRQSARAIIPTIICQAFTCDEIELGSLTPIRDFTFVKDTVKGFIKMGESESVVGKVINIGSGKGISIGELAQRILRTMGYEKKIVEKNDRFRPLGSEVMKLICSNQKARDILGWESVITLEEGIEETIRYYLENIQRYKPEIYNI